MTETVAVWGAGMVLSSIVAYFTTVNTLSQRLGVLEEREENHYHELLRLLDHINRKLP
jgi:hypothetical protein